MTSPSLLRECFRGEIPAALLLSRIQMAINIGDQAAAYRNRNEMSVKGVTYGEQRGAPL